jgi:hypothetical protein
MLRGRARRLEAVTEVAALIVGEAAPGWLVELLDWGLERLMVSRVVASIAPTRTVLRKTLDQMREAADLILHELYSPAVRDVLGSPPPGVLPDEEFGAALMQLAKRIERASTDGALISAGGQTKRGRGRVRTTNRLPPEVFCALLIAEAWRYFRGKAPAPGSLIAADIADKYWRLAGGATYEKSFEPLACWKSRFVEAVRGPSDPRRTEWIEKLRTEIVDRLR